MKLALFARNIKSIHILSLPKEIMTMLYVFKEA